MGNQNSENLHHLLVLQDLQGTRAIPLEAATLSIGRDDKNAIAINSPSVSRQHAILLRISLPDSQEHVFQIIDGNFQGQPSTNGILINGKKITAHHLQHGDVIQFSNQAQAKYYIIPDLSDENLLKIAEGEDFSENRLQEPSPFDTLIGSTDQRQEFSEAAIIRLASFPELIPNPIIEINSLGELTYSNPEAMLQFPRLRELGLEHPVLANLLSLIKEETAVQLIREIEVRGKIFEQAIHYIEESNLIRSFLTDITARKQGEISLMQRDQLLQGVTIAVTSLLIEPNLNTAINQALKLVGEGAKVDRVCLFKNHSHSLSEKIAMSMGYEWFNHHIVSASIDHPHWQDQPYHTFSEGKWYNNLSENEPITKTRSEFSSDEAEIFSLDQTQSFLLVPIFLNQYFWGYLGFYDCQQSRQWTASEQAVLVMLATSVSGALQRKKTENLIQYRALHDTLTQLPNRRLFEQEINNALNDFDKKTQQLAVLFLDLDRFKVINDTLGHTVGDKLLQEVARRLIKSIQPAEIVARWGGDEFVLLLPQASLKHVITTAEAILKAVEVVFSLEGHELYITTSIGITLVDQQNRDPEILLRQADTALYGAKEKGKNQYQFYTDLVNQKLPQKLMLERYLRKALANEELTLYYQPKINMLTREMDGLEALLRWHQPEIGFVSPNLFIPVAEEIGLIVQIGEWVLRTACAQSKAWQKAGFPPIVVSVNLSPRQFCQPGLEEMVTGILAETGLEPRYLELEITESIAIANGELTKQVLEDLHAHGVRISIDDFGTGHSSLSRLHSLPLDTLKIDQSFVRDLTTDSKIPHIIQAITTLGQQLGLNIVAEGVENQEQLDFLDGIKCDSVQGFFFYEPIPSTEVLEILKKMIS